VQPRRFSATPDPSLAAVAGRPARRVAFLLGVAVAVSAVLVVPGSANAAAKPPAAKPAAAKPAVATPAHPKTPPPNPSNTQIKAAAAAKLKAASDVGRLSGLIVGIDGKISHLSDVSELAGEKYLQARWNLGLAKTAATKAQSAVRTAQKNYDTARSRYRVYVAAAYMNRSGDASGLLTAQNPNVLLQRGDLSRYTTVRKIDALGGLTRATVARANAVSKARTAVALQASLTTKANNARIAAGRAVANAKSQRVTLVALKGTYQRQLVTAGEALTGLKNKRAAYLAWLKMEAKIKAAAARRARIARAKLLAAQAAERARLVRQEKLAQQRRDRLAAQRRAQRSSGNSSGSSHHSSSGSGSSNNGSSGNSSGSGSSSGGSTGSDSYSGSGGWSPAKGRAAVARAERWLGMPYSFAAGNAHGPSYGVCSYSNACHVYGFDCSGLSLYAWAGSGVYMDHYAASQYVSAGSVHPSVDQLQPGDLTFWSTGGVSGIHHVAIYIGNGNVVEAPHTGDVVKIRSLWFNGYYGATRPGT
jgi:cell wall-associated NlpC family hydrolase